MKHLIEGRSDGDMQEALEYAMAAAAGHLSHDNDLLISLVEQKVMRGGGCFVAIEVTQLPPGSQLRAREIAPVTDKQNAVQDERAAKRLETMVAWKKRIADHFRTRRGKELNTSRLHMETLLEGQIMGQIEQEFFNITHPAKLPTVQTVPDRPKPEKHDKEPE